MGQIKPEFGSSVLVIVIVKPSQYQVLTQGF